jgi:hypothetical protein
VSQGLSDTNPPPASLEALRVCRGRVASTSCVSGYNGKHLVCVGAEWQARRVCRGRVVSSYVTRRDTTLPRAGARTWWLLKLVGLSGSCLCFLVVLPIAYLQSFKAQLSGLDEEAVVVGAWSSVQVSSATCQVCLSPEEETTVSGRRPTTTTKLSSRCRGADMSNEQWHANANGTRRHPKALWLQVLNLSRRQVWRQEILSPRQVSRWLLQATGFGDKFILFFGRFALIVSLFLWAEPFVG